MARLGFTALAALAAGVTFALWVAPEAAGPSDEEVVSAPPSPAPVAEPVAAPEPVSATLAEPSEPAPALAAEPPANPTVPPESMMVPPESTPAVGVPSLPEETREIVEVADFEPDLGEEGPANEGGEPGDSTVTPVDVERSGDLIRRMLALYQRMGE